MTLYRQCPRDPAHSFASPADLVAAWRARTVEVNAAHPSWVSLAYPLRRDAGELPPYPDDVLFCQAAGCDGVLNPGPPAVAFGWPSEPDPASGVAA